MSQTSKTLKGLSVNLDRLVYFNKPDLSRGETSHMFIYFLTISNLSKTTVTLKGRRWVIHYEDGKQNIVDGQGIVGKEPTLAPGESFSYNSYHTSACNCRAHGSFHGTDSFGMAIHVRIPEFQMNIPSDTTGNGPKEIKPAES